MKVEQIERLARTVERVGNTVFVPIHEWEALLQLARAVNSAPVVELRQRDDDRGNDWLECDDCYNVLDWKAIEALNGQTVALVPVPGEEGK